MKNSFLQKLYEAKKEDGGGGGGSPDTLTAESVNKSIENAMAPLQATLASLGAALAKLNTPPEPKPTPAPAPEPKTKPSGKEVAPEIAAIIEEQNAKILQLTGKVTELDKDKLSALEDAEKATKKSALAEALAGVEFVTQEAHGIAVSQLFGKIQRSAIDHSLVIDGLPLKSAVAKEFGVGGSLLFMTKPKSAGGAGALNGGQGLDTVIPIGGLGKLPPEERAKVARQIAIASGRS